MKNTIDKKQNPIRAQNSPLRRGATLACVVALSLGVGIVPAMSFNLASAPTVKEKPQMLQNVSHETFREDYKLPSTVEDTCLSLLNMKQNTPSFSSTDRTRRSAGTLALGALLGIRFALESPQQPIVHTAANKKQSSGGDLRRTPESIAAFRHCRKMQALKKPIEGGNGSEA